MTGQLHPTSLQEARDPATLTAHSIQSLADEATEALRRERWRDAENLFVRLCRLAPRSAQAHYNLALLLKRRGEQAKAEFLLDRTLKIDPDYAPALFEAAVILIDKGRYRRAIRVLSRLATLKPDNPEIRMYLGMMLVECGEPGHALGHLRHAKRGTERAYYEAKALLGLGRLQEALAPLRTLDRRTALRLLSSQKRGVLFMDERLYAAMLNG